MIEEARYNGKLVAPSETDVDVKLGLALLCSAGA